MICSASSSRIEGVSGDIQGNMEVAVSPCPSQMIGENNHMRDEDAESGSAGNNIVNPTDSYADQSPPGWWEVEVEDVDFTNIDAYQINGTPLHGACAPATPLAACAPHTPTIDANGDIEAEYSGGIMVDEGIQPKKYGANTHASDGTSAASTNVIEDTSSTKDDENNQDANNGKLSIPAQEVLFGRHCPRTGLVCLQGDLSQSSQEAVHPTHTPIEAGGIHGVFDLCPSGCPSGVNATGANKNFNQASVGGNGNVVDDALALTNTDFAGTSSLASS